MLFAALFYFRYVFYDFSLLTFKADSLSSVFSIEFVMVLALNTVLVATELSAEDLGISASLVQDKSFTMSAKDIANFPLVQ